MNLEKRLRYWQKVLRLQDWEISVQEVGLVGLQGPVNHIAETNVDEFHRVAKIRILNKKENPTSIDQEHTLVHELLHVVLTRVSDGQETDREQAINSLAKALVGLERE